MAPDDRKNDKHYRFLQSVLENADAESKAIINECGSSKDIRKAKKPPATGHDEWGEQAWDRRGADGWKESAHDGGDVEDEAARDPTKGEAQNIKREEQDYLDAATAAGGSKAEGNKGQKKGKGKDKGEGKRKEGGKGWKRTGGARRGQLLRWMPPMDTDAMVDVSTSSSISWGIHEIDLSSPAEPPNRAQPIASQTLQPFLHQLIQPVRHQSLQPF